ncbi:BQ5605_C033g11202 [Microbotryum silenes-dioicae]|uniref:BQ5605_C033g11202 protein n=1 Tax=Microbotryum silenes-dioicae TaxID=796604 RepID=A0A2X0PI14_9BASI|nr:BQ5605_C033g11202 [Microbotryum silenes-dioicae]
MVYFHHRLLVLISGLSLLSTSFIAKPVKRLSCLPWTPSYYNDCHKTCHENAVNTDIKCSGLHPISNPYERWKYFQCLCDDYAGFDIEFSQCVDFGIDNTAVCKNPNDIYQQELDWCNVYPSGKTKPKLRFCRKNTTVEGNL